LLVRVPETIVPALISFDINSRLFGLEVVLAGWGKLENNLSPFILRTVTTKIISNIDCETIAERILERFMAIHERYLCTFTDPPALLTPVRMLFEFQNANFSATLYMI
jgi:hypothetical protein